jgi:two-component SAPR family response regulator
MIDILTVGSASSFGEFNDEIGARDDTAVALVDTGAGAFDILSEKNVDLVVIDETLSDMPGLDLARQVVARNPLVTVALVSALPGKAFHEATEGLGILAQLPPRPKRSDAGSLLENLARIIQLTQSAGV